MMALKHKQMKRIENIYEVTKRLCGMIEPQGESNIDAVRFENLEDTIDVAEKLIDDIIYVARHKDRYEASMSKAGVRADKFITELKNNVNTEEVFTRTQIEQLQSRIYEITGKGEVMGLFNEMLGIVAG